MPPAADLSLTAAALALVAGLLLTPLLFAPVAGGAAALSSALSPFTCLGVLALAALGLAGSRRIP